MYSKMAPLQKLMAANSSRTSVRAGRGHLWQQKRKITLWCERLEYFWTRSSQPGESETQLHSRFYIAICICSHIVALHRLHMQPVQCISEFRWWLFRHLSALKPVLASAHYSLETHVVTFSFCLSFMCLSSLVLLYRSLCQFLLMFSVGYES